MPLPSDPLLSQQWHLINTTPGLLDLNVKGVWTPAQGLAYSGAGIRVVVVDDGIDYSHPDLAPNYDAALDYDFATDTTSAFGLAVDAHGTAVAGIIGADNNGTGAVGVAYDASLVGYRVETAISDAWLVSVAEAIHHAAISARGDVINFSQGISNDPYSQFGSGYLAWRFDGIETSIGEAVDSGRGGLGSIIVKSAGNSRGGYVGAFDDYDVNADDWVNDTRQIVVAAVDRDGFVSFYSSHGAALLVSGFGTPGEVVTTDRTGAAGYETGSFTTSFNGTSAAAPMVSGVVALMLDANGLIGWRDVQAILANTARHVGSTPGSGPSGSEFFTWGWNGASTWNGGGLHFSNDYGFGLVDALAAVRLAESWLLGGGAAQTSANEILRTLDMLNGTVLVPDGSAAGTTFTGTVGADAAVERVTASITFSTAYLGDLDVYVISPDGTISTLLQDAAGGSAFNGTWTFESQAFRGERAAGQWRVRVVDDSTGDLLTVSDVALDVWGRAGGDDRYVFTNEYSSCAGTGGHGTAVTDGNGGTDTVNAAAVSAASRIRLDGVAGHIDGVAVKFNGIENAVGGDGNDTLVGSGGANALFGMRGADSVTGGAGNDSLDGGDGHDTVWGGAGNDTVNGGGGNETVYGEAGADSLLGGIGDDTLYGGNNYDTLDGGNGNDQAWGGNGRDLARLGNGDDVFWDNGQADANGHDTVWGGAGNDTVNGGGGNELIYGEAGADSLLGGIGDDTLWGGDNYDTVRGGDGNDQAWGGNGRDLIFLGNGDDVFWDNAQADANGHDTVWGGAGNDTVNGGGGNETVYGEAGADSLLGGIGDDTLWGGGLSIVQVIAAYASVIVSDTVFDFGGGNTVTLAGLASTGLLSDDILIV